MVYPWVYGEIKCFKNKSLGGKMNTNKKEKKKKVGWNLWERIDCIMYRRRFLCDKCNIIVWQETLNDLTVACTKYIHSRGRKHLVSRHQMNSDFKEMIKNIKCLWSVLNYLTRKWLTCWSLYGRQKRSKIDKNWHCELYVHTLWIINKLHVE